MRPAAPPQKPLYPVRVRNTPADRPRLTWAKYMQALREATGLSRPAMARRLNIDPATIWRWETGKQKPESPAVPQAIADLFGLDLDDVLTAAGLRLDRPPAAKPTPEPTLDPDLQIIMRRLTDPNVSEPERATIRATLRYLAQLADQQQRDEGDGKGRAAS